MFDWYIQTKICTCLVREELTADILKLRGGRDARKHRCFTPEDSRPSGKKKESEKNEANRRREREDSACGKERMKLSINRVLYSSHNNF
ncbi:hypothetical protein F511_45712 [Dorcoceras hygrometricum]|uniref:Uncharacterized protein n=1 Tax=Dorcoceras hygrometricum TaxID=472368 RepID=A0A2Z6ZV96_9LAMI|nr:hypothetical protein F511_45712 [Dorcoceras hygrometricum]